MTNQDYMKRALELAKKAMGYTSPNPMVGCVVVKDGRIVTEGYHERCGEYHAERNALSAPGKGCPAVQNQCQHPQGCGCGGKPPSVFQISSPRKNLCNRCHAHTYAFQKR